MDSAVPKENTPLLTGGTPVEEKGSVVTIQVPPGLSDGFSKATQVAFEKYAAAKAATQKSPWILSVVVVLSGIGVVWAGIFSILTKLISIKPIGAVMKLYQAFFGTVVIVLEVTRYLDPFGIGQLLRVWFRAVETSLGRGLLQSLTAVLAVVGWSSMSEWLPGLFLLAVGIINIIQGGTAAWKLKNSLKDLKRLERSASVSGSAVGGELSKIDLMLKKLQAADVNGTGKIDKSNLMQACEQLSLNLSKVDLDSAFVVLDKGNKGYVKLHDFEKWWLESKAASSMISTLT